MSITPSGDSDNTAGQIYILNCFVSVSGSADQPTILWLGNGTEIDFATDAVRTVSMTSGSDGSYSSTLTFNPLSASHAGTYICRATLGGAEVNGSTDIVIEGISMLSINNVILYSRKIWRGIKFGGLAVYITIAKLKSAKISYSHIIYVW